MHLTVRIFFFVRPLRDSVLELILLNLGCGARTGGAGGDKHDLYVTSDLYTVSESARGC